MEKIEYFDCLQLAKKMGVPNATLKKIEKKVSIPRQSRGLYDCWPLKEGLIAIGQNQK